MDTANPPAAPLPELTTAAGALPPNASAAPRWWPG